MSPLRKRINEYQNALSAAFSLSSIAVVPVFAPRVLVGTRGGTRMHVLSAATALALAKALTTATRRFAATPSQHSHTKRRRLDSSCAFSAVDFIAPVTRALNWSPPSVPSKIKFFSAACRCASVSSNGAEFSLRKRYPLYCAAAARRSCDAWDELSLQPRRCRHRRR